MSKEYLKKAAKRSAGSQAELEVVDAKFEAEYPALYCFIASNTDDEGKLRERCKIQIFAEAECWKVCLMDPQVGASLFLTLRTPQDAFKALEKALTSDRPDWRYWKNPPKKK